MEGLLQVLPLPLVFLRCFWHIAVPHELAFSTFVTGSVQNLAETEAKATRAEPGSPCGTLGSPEITYRLTSSLARR
jgi:hypothetical protein